MEGFALLLGHLVGDYIVQNDWMAANKTNPHPGPHPNQGSSGLGGMLLYILGAKAYRESVADLSRAFVKCGASLPVPESEWEAGVRRAEAWEADSRRYLIGHAVCTVHCLCYTLAVWLFTFHWMPWWGLFVCFAVHWPVDRFRLAKYWMERMGQYSFATGPLSPWSIIVVDNIFHLSTLYGIWLLS